MLLILQGRSGPGKCQEDFWQFRIWIFYTSALWLRPREKVGALNIDFCIKTSKNSLQVADCSGLIRYRARSHNGERLWFPKSVNVFVTKAYCLLHLWFGVFYVFWAGKRVDLEMHPRLALELRHAFSPFLQMPQRQVDHMHFLQPSLFFMKTFTVINPKAHPVSCRSWEESSHHAQLARYFLEHFVTSAVCRLVCRKPFSAVWLTCLVHVLGVSLTTAEELERNLLQDLILFFFWGGTPLWVWNLPLRAFCYAYVDIFYLTDSLTIMASVCQFSACRMQRFSSHGSEAF